MRKNLAVDIIKSVNEAVDLKNAYEVIIDYFSYGQDYTPHDVKYFDTREEALEYADSIRPDGVCSITVYDKNHNQIDREEFDEVVDYTDEGSDSAFESVDLDKKDTVTLDIPLLVRVFELLREDVPDDIKLHEIVEKLLDIKNKGVLTMDDYEYLASPIIPKEED